MNAKLAALLHTIPPKPTALALAALVTGLLLSHVACPAPEPATWNQRVGALLADSVRYEDDRHRLADAVAQQVQRADILERVVHRLQGAAAVHQHVADTVIVQLPADTTAQDSIHTLTVAYQARTEEAKTLRLALSTQMAVSGQLRGALVTSDSMLALATARVAVLTDALVDRPQSQRCHVLGVLPCPSRSASFLLGAATVVTATLLLK